MIKTARQAELPRRGSPKGRHPHTNGMGPEEMDEPSAMIDAVSKSMGIVNDVECRVAWHFRQRTASEVKNLAGRFPMR
jgi:hypothetical protein